VCIVLPLHSAAIVSRQHARQCCLSYSASLIDQASRRISGQFRVKRLRKARHCPPIWWSRRESRPPGPRRRRWDDRSHRAKAAPRNAAPPPSNSATPPVLDRLDGTPLFSCACIRRIYNKFHHTKYKYLEGLNII
jgi:hypothetical protein